MVQGLGQRRGACSEFSPGIPFMWRKVEMRLACTATRLPPTPAETYKTLDMGVGVSREGMTNSQSREDTKKEDNLPHSREESFPGSSRSLCYGDVAVPSAPGVAESIRDTGRSTDSGSLAAPPVQCVHLLLHTDGGRGPALPQPELRADPGTQCSCAGSSDKCQVSGLSSSLWNLVPCQELCLLLWQSHFQPTPCSP